jgi:site-specific DNA recombinase
VLRLVVQDILIGPEKITIRHRIPIREHTPASDSPSPDLDIQGDMRPGYQLGWRRGLANPVQQSTSTVSTGS